ncbi:MAG TPA: alanine--tRNA ligase-related protein [Terriglobales bacterium]|nr:alanine--tRNA ligase-related protein [Terriglobales bacterium]
MTERLYYNDSFLYEFDATVMAIQERDGRTVVVLDRTAFYPASGGQIFDTGWLQLNGGKLRVAEVAEDESGSIVHYIEGTIDPLLQGATVHGEIDSKRRHDHMQQHSGQHVLSAAFERLFAMPTVSFHMGDESCTIDLAAKALSDEQVRAAEREANRVASEDLTVSIKSASVEAARAMGVRKIPDHVEGDLRLIDMEGYDLNACGGTHVRSTGQIGAILLRKYEKVKQGFRVEFVCGERAVATARKDFETLTEAAGLFATHIWEVPSLIRKSLDESKAATKERKKLLEELAELLAGRMLAESETVFLEASANSEPEAGESKQGFKLVTSAFDDRDTVFIKLLAQKITASQPAVALFGAKLGQPGVVFAQSPGLPNDMGALLKQALESLGGRGGGNRDLAQGGVVNSEAMGEAIAAAAAKIQREGRSR